MEEKAYITALGKSVLRVLDLKNFPYRMKAVKTQGCRALEDLAVGGQPNLASDLYGGLGSERREDDIFDIRIRNEDRWRMSHPHNIA
jgi:hypothetical protein